jgi:uncharacterized repeat protein (TIGR01451 family)
MCTFVVLAVLGMAPFAAAQVVRPFTFRFQTDVPGDIRLIGNTLMYCPQPGANGCTGTNNSFSMVHFKDTPDATVLNRSTADLLLPAGATVEWAGLYWGGRSGSVSVPANRQQMKFRTPQTPVGTYETITSEIPLDTCTSGSLSAYQGFATVTTLVSAAGSGTYVGADVKSSTGANAYAGWALVVVFRSEALPLRNLVVFDGFCQCDVERDSGHGGYRGDDADWLSHAGLRGLSNACGGRGVRRRRDHHGGPDPPQQCESHQCGQSLVEYLQQHQYVLGNNVTTRNPSFANLLGIDIDVFEASGILPNGATSTTLTFTTRDEQFYPGVFTLANDIFQPVVEFTLTVTDIDGGIVEPEDILEYVMRGANIGNDATTDVVLNVPIPPNTTYEPNSMAILVGANAGLKTDEAGDDLAEFTGTAVRFRLGVGANADQGGVLVPGTSGSLRFRVRINAGVPGNTVISNQATLVYRGAISPAPLVTNSDGDPGTAGLQPTTITTAQARADVSSAKAASPNPVVAGQELTYTLTVTNAGPTAASGVQVTDLLPAGLTLVSATPSQGTYAAGTGVWDIGALANGGRVTLDLVATVTQPGSMTALATKSAQGEDDPVRAGAGQWMAGYRGGDHHALPDPLEHDHAARRRL